ncbi:hypothetical protein [Coleofasciculus sp. E1-EBD-02]|uniref:hypothetical protein n=1 Tax=Coleofasciculus sp. E1-EBD-02 TaxID=3068481 RepID=UPI0032F5F611
MNNGVHSIDSGRPVIQPLGNGALRFAVIQPLGNGALRFAVIQPLGNGALRFAVIQPLRNGALRFANAPYSNLFRLCPTILATANPG